ncbi:MAG: Ig-like domain-containing protein [Aureliella sp.]
MTRQQKQRRFANWIRALLRLDSKVQNTGDVGRRILVEPLENRQLLAGDAFNALLGSAHEPNFAVDDHVETGLVGEGELVAEGEPAPDLVAFAKALADSGTQFFGAAWCPFCTEQKELFEDGGKFLPFIEVTNPDRTPNQIATDEGITEYPTWEFPDGSRLTGLQTLDTLSSRAGVPIPQSETPSFDDLQDVSVQIGSPLHIPIDAYDPDGDPLTITVTSSDSSLVEAEVLQGNRSLLLNVAGFGDMVFELFENRAPAPTGRVIELAEDGFYDGVTFHRVIDNFVIQGGDPTGTGAGGSTLGDFDDQFHLDLQHNRTGVLSYAKSTDDTNDSQFFITEGPQRFLDFNHSVFGQLVEGEDNREAISNTATNASDRPTNTVTIESASVFTDNENGVIVLRPTGSGTGTATITVTVTDSDNNSTSQTFEATVTQDTANGAPFLNPISTVETDVNTPVQLTLTSQDAESDTPVYSVQAIGNTSFGLEVDSSTGVVTVTPPTDFTGQLQFVATVRQSTTATTSSQDDNQVVTVQVNETAVGTPTSVDLDAASDSGTSDSDNITNANSLTFTVAGTTSGANVQILADGVVVGSATASSSTTQVVVTNAAAINEGTVAFTATQTSGAQTSDASPALNVVLDRTQPGLIGDGVIPSTAVVGQELAVNLELPGEGQGLTYALTTNPAGMTLGATDGELRWTPASGQVGAQTVGITMTDVAGNQRAQDFSINVIEDPDIRIGLNLVDDGGQPITRVDVGQTFTVQVTVEDLRGFSATGVFAAYVDLVFDSTVIQPIANNPIENITPFTNDPSGDANTPGLINELGGFTGESTPTGSGERVLAEVTFTAVAAGSTGLTLNAADDPGNDVLVFSENQAVSSDRIDFSSIALDVGADFTLADDVFNFDEDAGQQTLDVLANDTTGNSTLTIVSVGATSGGGIATVASGGGSISYTSAANFNGAETFTYTVENQDGIQATATVTVQLAAVNDPPLALNDSFSVAQNSTNNVLDVLANDNSGVDDSNGESLTVTAVSVGSEGGTLSVTGSGTSVTYSPRADFTGTETFTYTLSDGLGGNSTGSVTVNVDVANPPPVVQNDSFNVTEDAAQATFDVLANDTTDDSTETLSISAVQSSFQGSTFQVSSDGLSVIYAPGPNFTGQEIIGYTVRDSGGAEATGLVTFTVAAVNDAPDALNDTATAIASEATTAISVLANDVDVDGDSLTITAVTQPSSGTVTIASDGQSVLFAPASSSFEGTVTFTYTIEDPSGESDTATVQVDVRDFVPRAFTGTVAFGSSGSNSVLSRIPIQLTGTDFAGQAVSLNTTVGADGGFSFDNLPPGDYTLAREALPFLHDSGETIQINSAQGDGDLATEMVVQGNLRPEFFDIRDFLGSTFSNSLVVAVDDAGAPAWTSGVGEWASFSTLDVNVDDSDNFNVSGVDGSATNVSGTIAISDSSTRAFQAGRESNFRLLRIPGTPSDVGVVEDAGSSGAGEGEGESSQADSSVANESVNTLVGEGEATPPVTIGNEALPTPQIVEVARTDIVERAAPNQVLRQLLGSANRDQVLATNAPDSAAVDEAMKDVLPSLRVGLSNDLQDALSADNDQSLEVNDELISRLGRLR